MLAKENKMKAMVYYKYGSPDVLELKEIEKPIANDDEVLVKVHTAAVTPYDWHFLTGTPYIARIMAGLFKPKNNILGIDMAGRIEAVGKNIKQFQPGDEVFGRSNGGYAEYTCAPADELFLKPTGMSFEKAAAIPLSAFTALICLCDLGQVKSGQKVLINGASGGVGTLAVQLARYFGAEVTGVCSTTNLELVKSLGADKVIDYTKEDFTESRELYDIIFDAVGKNSFSNYKKALTPNGTYVTIKKGIAKVSTEDLIFLKELIEAGKIKPVIDRRYSLEQIAEAHSYVEKGTKREM
jgi:NADPH:quinone reductase-like Zn-dependent oxidoreductase